MSSPDSIYSSSSLPRWLGALGLTFGVSIVAGLLRRRLRRAAEVSRTILPAETRYPQLRLNEKTTKEEYQAALKKVQAQLKGKPYYVVRTEWKRHTNDATMKHSLPIHVNDRIDADNKRLIRVSFFSPLSLSLFCCVLSVCRCCD